MRDREYRSSYDFQERLFARLNSRDEIELRNKLMTHQISSVDLPDSAGIRWRSDDIAIFGVRKTSPTSITIRFLLLHKDLSFDPAIQRNPAS